MGTYALDNAQRVVRELKEASGEYARWALQARQDYIKLRLKQDPEIRKLYLKAAQTIAAELRSHGSMHPLMRRQLEAMESLLRQEYRAFNAQLKGVMESHIERAVKISVAPAQQITLDAVAGANVGLSSARVREVYVAVNHAAIEAIWARTTKGLYLSERIWHTSKNFGNVVTDIIRTGVATGQDAVTTARALERYVRTDAKTFARDYPNMMKRMKGRVPGDISYEALRLARTEMTAAYGEGVIVAGRVSPGYLGVKFILSNSHPVPDICDDLAAVELFKAGDEPHYPPHPNCYDDQTDVYTSEGWKRFKDVRGDELILSINPDTQEIEWSPIVHNVAYHYQGDMISFKSHNFDLLVTPNHRMYFSTRCHIGKRKWRKYHIDPAENLIKRREFGIPRTGTWAGEEPESISVNGLEVPTELYCKLMGYYLSEGCAHVRKDDGRTQVTISQAPEGLQQIVDDLKDLPFHTTVAKYHLYISDKRVRDYFLRFGKSGDKYVPDEIKQLSPRLIRAFLDAYCYGDGSERVVEREGMKLSSREREYFTGSNKMASDIGELILKAGHYPSYTVQKSKGIPQNHRTGVYVGNMDVWRIRENRAQNAMYHGDVQKGLKFQHVPYDGMVYDVQLAKNHVLWVRRNGKTCWSGNCLCALVPVYEDPNAFVDRLKAWGNDPRSQPDLENWYQNIYNKKG